MGTELVSATHDHVGSRLAYYDGMLTRILPLAHIATDDTLPRAAHARAAHARVTRITVIVATQHMAPLGDTSETTRIDLTSSRTPRSCAGLSDVPDFCLSADELRAVEDSGEWERAAAANEHPLHTVLRIVGISDDGYVLTQVSEESEA